MSRPSTIAPQLWKSRGMKIGKSIQHKEMFLVTDLKTNTGHAINTSDEVILAMYPPDQERSGKNVNVQAMNLDRVKYATDKGVAR